MRQQLSRVMLSLAVVLLVFTTPVGAQSENSPPGSVYVEGSMCVSGSAPFCGPGESFSNSADLKVKGNIPVIYFEDTGGTGSNEFYISTTDDMFAIYDDGIDGTLNRRLFALEAGAPANSLFIDSVGNVGLGTSTPAQELHLASNGPSIRFDDIDGSQVWHLHGNQGGFYVYDITGSRNALWIEPGNGYVGIGGTQDPDVMLHVMGDAKIEGDFSVLSSRRAKEIMAPVSTSEVLSALEDLPILTWRYKEDARGAVHMGPTSEALHAAFGLGADREHLSPVDTAGIAMASIQELARLVEAQAREIDELQAEREDLVRRVEMLESSTTRVNFDVVSVGYENKLSNGFAWPVRGGQ